MPQYEKAIEFINKYRLLMGISNEEGERLSRIIQCSCAEFWDLPDQDHKLFERFAGLVELWEQTGEMVADQIFEADLDVICAERMLVLAPNKASNDRNAARLLNAAVRRKKLNIRKEYERYGDKPDADKKVVSVSYEIQSMFGPIDCQFGEMWYDYAHMPKDDEAWNAKAAGVMCAASAIVLLLNLFVPSAAQVLTSEKLKWVYMLVFAGTVILAPFGLDDAVRVVGLVLMLILGSLMFNMFPLYAAMKIQSVVATALLCIGCGLFFKIAKRKGVIDEHKNRLRQIRLKAKYTHLYADKLIHTLQKETPMKSDGFAECSQEELKMYSTFLDRYCDLLRSGLKEMDRNMRKLV